MHITGEIDPVGGGKLTAPEDAAIYLINFNGHAALVDAGCGRAQPQLLDNIRAGGVDPEQIEYLLLTHCHFDHTGGAQARRELLIPDCSQRVAQASRLCRRRLKPAATENSLLSATQYETASKSCSPKMSMARGIRTSSPIPPSTGAP